MIILMKFLLYMALLYILDFVLLIEMLIVGVVAKPYTYILGIILILISKIIFDIKFHKMQEDLKRNI